MLADNLYNLFKMLEEVVVSTQSANFKERIEECYGDRETGDDFQYFYYEHNLEFFLVVMTLLLYQFIKVCPF